MGCCVMAFRQDVLHLLQSAVLRGATSTIGDTEEIRFQCVQLMSDFLQFVSTFGSFRWEKFKTDGLWGGVSHAGLLR